MRYALLDFLACQHCHAELACFTADERDAPIAAGPWRAGTRVSAGRGLGPIAHATDATPLDAFLGRMAGAHAEPSRNFEVEVERGLLICGRCGRWYPIVGGLPEVLPDHLRDVARDREIYGEMRPALPPDLAAALDRFSPAGSAIEDAGAHHKHAEIRIKDKVDEPDFFGPGYSSPFNPWNTPFTLYLITLLGNVAPLLELKGRDVLLDSGCGYAWTTEWFHRSGVDAIGLDICRTYLDIGVERMGAARPHLVVGDVENLPVRSDVADAVLAYESFHHIPNRAAAMRSYERALKENGRVVLAEPGGAHEDAQVSVDVMKKYGILEKGMELVDVIGYAAGTSFGKIQQHVVVRALTADANTRFDRAFMRAHKVVESNLFSLVKGGSNTARPAPGPLERRRVWPKVKRRIKAALLRIGLD